MAFARNVVGTFVLQDKDMRSFYYAYTHRFAYLPVRTQVLVVVEWRDLPQ